MIRNLLVFIYISTLLQSAGASVNMRNGSYSESFIDFLDPQDGYELKIERFYNSRSLFVGLFGFGWCSELETYLTRSSDGIINLTECGGGLEATYYPEDFDLKSSQKTINDIVAHYKKTKNMSANELKNLRTQLQSNTKMRFEYANRLFLVDTKKVKVEKNSFLSKSKGVEKIIFNGQYYERRRRGGKIERYDRKGRLTRITNATGQWIKLSYKGKFLSHIVDNIGRRLSFSYQKNGKLKKIYNARGLKATYVFDGDNLTSVTNIWQKTYNFSYDANHNLTSVQFPDKTAIVMSYDIGNDWIKSYTNRIGCREDFKFSLSQDDPKNHYWGDFTRKCKGGSTTTGRHEFWYKKYSFSNEKYLYRVKEVYQNQVKDIYFHPYLGKPVSIRDNSSYLGFAYFLNGLVNKRESKKYTQNREILDWTKTIYRYNLSTFQISEMDHYRLNKLGKVTNNKKSFFQYGTKGLLSRVFDKAGRFVKIAFGKDTKVSSLANEKKEILRLIYDTGRRRPREIRQDGIGKVVLTYDNRGEVTNIETKSKRNVATSIIETFLGMVEFLGPAGTQLKI